MNCRHCGSGNIISQGRRIICKDCSKQSTKILRRNTPRAEDRPTCPECGNSNPYSAGSLKGIRNWNCRSCGRYYHTTPERDKVELPILEVQIE